MILESKMRFFKQLNTWGCLGLMNAFRQMGIFLHQGECYNFKDIREKLDVIPRYDKLFDAIIYALGKELDVLEINNNKIITTKILDNFTFKESLEDMENTKEELICTSPEMKPYVDLLWVCINNYFKILKGNVLATDIIFPNSSMELVDKIYKDNPISDFFNNMVAESVEVYVTHKISELLEGDKINIIEIGAGTGGTSKAVMKVIEKYAKYVRYVYTDISPAFLLYGKDNYKKQYDFLEFKIFDIENNTGLQEEEISSYDIVIGANVFHATKVMKNTLKNAKNLLKPYGWLIANELTKVNCFNTLTFGLLDGWWLAEDSKERIENSPLLSRNMWEHVLKNEGFNNVVMLKGPENMEDLSFQSVIISENDGLISEKDDYKEEKILNNYDDKIQLSSNDINENNSDIENIFSQHLYELLIEILQINESNFSSTIPLWDYGVDSILSSYIVNKINKTFKIELKTTDLFSYSTGGKLSNYIYSEFINAIQSWYFTINETHKNENTISEENETILQKKTIKEKEEKKQGLESHNIPFLNEGFTQNKDNIEKQHRIAIIGLSGKFPEAQNAELFWDNLIKGVNCITNIPKERWNYKDFYSTIRGEAGKSYCNFGGFISDVYNFDPLFFNISPRQAELMDPRQRLFLQEAWKTIEDAGYSAEEVEGKRCGVFVGCEGSSDYCYNVSQDYSSLNANNFLGNSNSILASRISYYMDLKGPSVTIDTACSSSMVAIHLACESILNGDCDMAIAGGVQIITDPKSYILMSQMGMLSPKGRCYTFDNNANGFVPGEAVGAVLLKPVEDALRDGDHIYAVIVGSGINQDGKSNGITAPNWLSQMELECSVYDKFNINPETISYIEAHGTGTKLGDPIEVKALSESFKKYTDKKQFCFIGSAKTNVGHAGAASGIVSVVKILQSLKYKMIPPTINYNTLNKDIDFENSPFKISTEPKEFIAQGGEVIRAAISGFGHSGTNCHIVLQEPPVRVKNKQLKENPIGYIFPISAKTKDALKNKIKELSSWLDKEAEKCCIDDIAYTMQRGRSHFLYRVAFVAASIEEFKNKVYKMSINDSIYSMSGEEIESSILKKEALNYYQIINDANSTSEDIKKSLNNLADIYIKGYNLDWNKLNKGMNGKRISMPTYPFADENYYVSTERLNIGVNKDDYYNGRIHPMIDVNASTLKEEKFKKRLTGNEKYLAAHVIGGQKVLPGVAYIEMARAAGEFAGESRVFKLKDIFWIRPIVVEEPMDVQICIFPENDSSRFEVYSERKDNTREIHAQGKLIYDENISNKSQPINENPSDILKRCKEFFDAKKCYDIFKDNELQYGEYFKSISNLYFNKTEVIANLTLTKEAESDFDNYALHPAILDGAIQAAIGLVVAKKVGKAPLLTFSVDQICIFRSLKTIKYAYVCYSNEKDNTDSKINSFNIKLLDEVGNVLVQMDNFVIRELVSSTNSLDQVNIEDNARSLFYKSKWIEAPVSSSVEKMDTGNILIFKEESNIIPDMGKNIKVSVVNIGNSFLKLGEHKYQIRPDIESEYYELISTLIDENNLPDKVLILWGENEKFLCINDMNEYLNMSFYPIFNLVKALIKHKVDKKIQIFSAYGTSTESKYAHIEALSGFSHTIAIENPNFLCKTIGLLYNDSFEGATEFKDYWSLLMSEVLSNNTDEFEVKFLNGDRFVKSLEQLDISEINSESELIKDEKVYLITGGAGGLGLIFANHILSKAKAKIILTGRADFGIELKDRISSLKDSGSNIFYIKSDISSFNETKKLVEEIKLRFGRLDGVIHSAGVVKDSYLLNKTLDEVDAVLRPKVYGITNLDIATKGENLEFFISFSSISSVVGNAGQSDYSYANCFIDCYTEYREKLRSKGERSGKTISIAWPLWADGGMNVSAQSMKYMKEFLGIIPMSTDEGVKNFEHILMSGVSSSMIFYGDSKTIKSRLDLRKKMSSQSEQESYSDREISLIDDAELYSKAERFFKEILSNEIKLPVSRIDSRAQFEVYGIDSIIILNLNKVIEDHFGQLSKTLFFEYKNIKEITEYFIKKHREQLIKKLGMNIKDNNSIENKKSVIDNVVNKRFMLNTLAVENKAIINNDIAIIGIAGRYPMADNLEELWSNLKDGKDCITEIPRERWNNNKYFESSKDAKGKNYSKWGGFINDVDQFDPLFFNISPREAEKIDPQERLFLEIVWRTFEDAGYSKTSIEKSNVGVFVGVMYGDYRLFSPEEYLVGNYVIPRSSYASIANRISYFFNLYGPSIALDTMCSSSLTSIHLACESIAKGECNMAIAGGVNLTLHPNKYLLLSDGKFASSDGRCRSFGEGGDGYVPGEGVGAILLKPLSQAIADGDNIQAVIKGTAINHGGKTNGYTVPSPSAQSDVILKAIEKSGVIPSSISYIEAHGTGTSLGDPIEITGLTKAFEKYTNNSQFCSIGSIKSNIGHLESAAGIASITKVILQMKHRKIVPSIHSENLNSNINFKDTPFYVPQQLAEWNRPIYKEDGQIKEYPRIAGISAFGAGGSNAHIILQEYEPDAVETSEDKKGSYLFVFSSKDEKKLISYIKEFLKYINNDYLSALEESNINISDIAYTLQVGRDEMEQRLAVIARSMEDLSNKLERYLIEENDIEDIFKCNVYSQDISELLLDDEEGQTYIKNIINKNKLKKIAQLWVKGISIPWHMLYSGLKLRRISIPGYQFDKERYWIERHIDDNYEFSKKIHPLIDEVVPCIEKCAKFRKTLRISEPIVGEHRVNGVPVFPGVGYLEMAYAAASTIRNDISSLNITWLNPLYLENEDRTIQIVIDETETLNFEIQSLKNDKVIIHAKGILGYNRLQERMDKQYISIEKIKSRCSQSISRENLYSKFNKLGIDYGAYFQGVYNVWLNESEAFCELKLDKKYKYEMKDFVFHPTLMDGALQAAAGLIERKMDVNNRPILPYAIEKVEILDSLTSTSYSYVTIDDANRYNIAVINENGLVCIKLYGVSFRKSKDILNNFYYLPKWVPENINLNTIDNYTNRNEGKTIFLTRHMQGSAILNELKRSFSNDNLIQVILGNENLKQTNNLWKIRYNEQSDWDNCIEKIGNISTIYFLAPIENQSNDIESIKNLDESLEYGILSLFRLIKALNKQSITKNNLDIRIITNDASGIHNEKIRNPYASSIYGFIRSASKEYPAININCCDISLKELAENHMDISKLFGYKAWMAENEEKSSGRVYAFRNGKRYKTIIETLALNETYDKLSFKDNGVYIIIGGAGGIGLEFADYISKTANVILIGRSDYDYLKPIQKERIEEINNSGGKVAYIKADGTDINGMNKVILKIKEKYGKINGVIHSAIVLRDKTIANLDEDTLISVLNPKIKGSVVLYNVLKDEQIDFVLFFSSAQSYTGNIGQSNYAAACTFQDAFSKFMNNEMTCDVKVINWGYWGTVGVVANENYNKLLAEKGIKSIIPKEGIQVVQKVLTNSVNQVIAIKADDDLMESIGCTFENEVEMQTQWAPSVIEEVVESSNNAMHNMDVFCKGSELERFQKGMKLVEELGCSLVFEFFRNMGTLENEKKYNINELSKKLGILSKYQKLYESMLDILKHAGAIEINGDEIVTMDINNTDIKSVSDIERLLEDYKEVNAYKELLRICIKSYPEVLTGRKNYTEVMFPGNSMSLVENIYKNNTLVDYYNNLVAFIVKKYIESRINNNEEKFKIVEIGAGTGGTSTFVLNSILEFSENISYYYTDISQIFTKYGDNEFGEKFPFVNFKVLDIEKNPLEQEIDPGSVDIVFGTNIFHATRNISHTINNVKKMLKANGIIMVNEVIEMQSFATLTFGLTGGWWLFEDEEIRIKGAPLLSKEKWRQVMLDNGIFNVHSINLSREYELKPIQSIIVGESDGMYSNEKIGKVQSIRETNSTIEQTQEVTSTVQLSEIHASDSIENLDVNKIAREYVKSIFSEILKIDKNAIDEKSNFEKYGVDSLIVMEITRRFEKDFGNLPATLLFEYISVDALSEYFVKNHSETFKKKITINKEETIKDLNGLFSLNHMKDIQAKNEEIEKKDVFEIKESSNENNITFELEKMQRDKTDIAIIGISGRYPLSNNLDELWDNLIKGKNCISKIPKDRWDSDNYFSQESSELGKMYTKWGGFIEDVDKFDSLFFNISKVEAKKMDPQERLFMETAWSTFEDAGYTRSSLKQFGNNVGVFAGVMNGSYALLGADEWANQNVTGARSSHWSVANRVSYFFDLNGPSLAVDTACSSSLTAIHLACESLRNGECNMALAGGVNIIVHPLHFIGLCDANMLSKSDKCKAFGDEADGFIDGEGVGAVLLKPLDKAIEDRDSVYAVIKGSAINAGGKTSGYTVPNPNAQANVILNALKKAKVDPRTISYVETHGTGTSLGDPIEIAGLSKAYREYTLDNQFSAIGSVKSNIGHLESAAGIAGLTKIILQLKHNKIVPSIHSAKTNPNICFETTPFFVQQKPEIWKQQVIWENGERKVLPRRAGLSAFGAGGSNAHVIIEEFIQQENDREARSNQKYLFVISAKTETSLKEYIKKFISYLEMVFGYSQNPKENRQEFIKSIIMELTSYILKVESKNLNLDESLSEYGFNQMTIVNLIQEINQRYNLDLTPESFFNITSLSELVNGLEPTFENELELSNSDYKKYSLKDHKKIANLDEIAYTLQVGREEMSERIAIIASSIEELIDKLKMFEEEQLIPIGVFRNKVNKFNVSKEDNEELEQLTIERNLEELAKAWVNGYKINWILLYKASKLPHKVSIPTYYFDKERCWINIERGKINNKGAKALYPLIDKIAPDLSLKDGVVFKKILKRADSIVADHCVEGVPVLPVAGYLEMVYEAVLEIKPEVTAFQIIWLQPLKVDSSEVEIQIHIYEDYKGLNCEIKSIYENKSTIHAKVLARPDVILPNSENIVVEDIKANCNKIINIEELKNYFNSQGVKYGPYFNGLNQLMFNNYECLSVIKLSEDLSLEISDYRISPVLIDAIFQSVAGFASKINKNEQRMMPFSIEAFKLLKPLTTTCYIHITINKENSFNVSVFDQDYSLCMILCGITFREIPNYKRDIVYAFNWELDANYNQNHNHINSSGGVLIVYPYIGLKLVEALKRVHKRNEIAEIVLNSDCNLSKAIGQLSENGFLKRVDAVYFIGGILLEEFNLENLSQYKENFKIGTLSLFRVIQELDKVGVMNNNITIKVITNFVHLVKGSEGLNPYDGSIYGLTKTISNEYPQVDISCIDIDFNVNMTELQLDILSQMIEKELPQKNGQDIAIRNGQRYVKKMHPASISKLGIKNLREGGVYVILGGAGGIGLELAKYLCKKVHAKVILTGRNELNDSKKAKFEEVRAEGGEVSYLKADITNYAEMQELIFNVKNKFGIINGVFHSAAILRRGLIKEMDEETFKSVLAPKTVGSIIQYELLKNEPLDFMVFFSSIQSFLGNSGQSNYAAASCFEDAFACYLNQKAAFPVKTVNWGYWNANIIVSEEMRKQMEVLDIKQNNDYEQYLGALGFETILVEEGLDLIPEVLSSKLNQVAIVKGEKDILKTMGLDKQRDIIAYPVSFPSLFNEGIKYGTLSEIQYQGICSLEDAFHKLEKIGSELLIVKIQKMDIWGKEPLSHTVLRERLNIKPRHFRQFDCLWDRLSNSEIVNARENYLIFDLETEDLKARDRELQIELEQLIETFPVLEHHARLLRVCINNFINVLSGKIPATDVLFPDSSTEMVEKIYRGNDMVDYFNNLVVENVISYIQHRLPKMNNYEKIRIIEVGSGTGGTTRAVLEAINKYAEHISYVFTDLSSSLIKYGKKYFSSKYPFMTFEILDIEKDAIDQGFKSGNFDLVIAANVLHATKNMRSVIKNVKQFLKPNGWLIINEVTENRDFLNLTFGLVDGWWLYDDDELRINGSPLLRKETWKLLLNENGFGKVTCLGYPDTSRNASPQHVIVAESDGIFINNYEKYRNNIFQAQQSSFNKLEENEVINKSEVKKTISDTKDNLGYIEGKVTECLSNILEIDKLRFSIDVPFAEYGVDSILSVKIIAMINEKLQIKLRTTDLFSYATIKSLAKYIYETFKINSISKTNEDFSADLLKEEIEISSDEQILSLLQGLERGELEIDEVDKLTEELL